MINKVILFSCAILALNVSAEIPHTFKANTPAKASEVNENFKYLDEKIEDKKSIQAEPYKFECSDNHVDYPYVYSRKEAPLGTLFTISGIEYRLVKVKFTDPKTNDVYHMTYPVRSTGTINDVPYVSFSKVNLSSLREGAICENNKSIFNQPLAYDMNIGFTITSGTNYSNIYDARASNYQSNNLKKSLYFATPVVIGSQFFHFTIWAGSNTTTTLVDSNDYDFTDNDIDSTVDFSSNIRELSNLLDHIFIEKISQ